MQSRCYRCWRTDSTWPIRLPNDWSIKAFVFPPPPLHICMRNDRTDHCLARIPSDRRPSICQTGFWVCWGLFHQQAHSARSPCEAQLWRWRTPAMMTDKQPAAGEKLPERPDNWPALLEPPPRRHFPHTIILFFQVFESTCALQISFSAVSDGCALRLWEKRNFPVAFFFLLPFPDFMFHLS